MRTRFQRFQPCLWFDDQAEAAAAFYVATFDRARVVATTRYNADSARASGRPEGSVLTVEFELDGQNFTALNGGATFRFNEAVSLVVNCHDQQEVDRYWDRLSAGGDPAAQQCGWLKDRWGVSWQIVPVQLTEMMLSADPEVVRKSTAAMLDMRKIDIAALQRAVAA